MKVAVVGTRYTSLGIEEEGLAPLGVRLVSGWGGTAEELLEVCRGADVVLAGSPPKFTAEVLGGMPGLRAIVRYGIGVDSVDLKAAAQLGITVVNVPDYCLEEVSTHAVAMILALNRRLLQSDHTVRSGTWSIASLRPMDSPCDQVVGIAGLGQIGRLSAQKLSALGFRLLGFDPYIRPEQLEGLPIELVDLETLLRESDYVNLHAPLVPGTRHMIGAEQLAMMKPGAYIVNTSRGPLVDNVALARALDEGRIAGAALDVLEQEPPSADHPLVRSDRVMLSPHSAWYTRRSELEMRRKAVAEAARIIRGEPPLHPVRG